MGYSMIFFDKPNKKTFKKIKQALVR